MLENLEKELKLKGFSKETVKTYLYHNKLFLNYIKKPQEEITEEDINSYISAEISKKATPRTLALKKSALKFYYNEVLKKNIVNITTPKISKSIPEFLTKEEISSLIKANKNIKSCLIIKFLYATGLRVSELINLKINDTNLETKECWIRYIKSSKDRLFKIPDSLLSHIKEHIQTLPKETEFLFPSQNKQMTARNVQKIIQRAAKRAKINKTVTPSILRHSYAIHLLNEGVDIRLIQELLGHSQLSTTKIYTDISKRLKKSNSLVNSAIDTEKIEHA